MRFYSYGFDQLNNKAWIEQFIDWLIDWWFVCCCRQEWLTRLIWSLHLQWTHFVRNFHSHFFHSYLVSLALALESQHKWSSASSFVILMYTVFRKNWSICFSIYFHSFWTHFMKLSANIRKWICHTHTRLTALFRDYPGEPVPER